MQVLFEWPAQWDTCIAVLSMVFKVCFEFEFEMCSQKKVSRGNFQLHSVSVAQCTRMYVCMYMVLLPTADRHELRVKERMNFPTDITEMVWIELRSLHHVPILCT